VKTAGGKVLKGTFSVKPDGVNEVRLRLVEESGSVAKGG
jgi:hypothetical protein